jgi:hypothetical protein
MDDEGAWETLPEDERYWSLFDQRFSFTPGFEQPAPPGITEPVESVTFSLAPIYGSESRFLAGTAALNAEVLRAFVEVFPEDERVLVLDWQHPSYWFRPHIQARRLAREHDGLGMLAASEWNVTPFPDGDYYIFLSEDQTTGTFGHPWEQSICVFGPALVAALAPCLQGWLPVLRRGGVVGGEPT